MSTPILIGRWIFEGKYTRISRRNQFISLKNSVTSPNFTESTDRLYRTLVENFPNGIVTIFDSDYRYLVVGGTKFDELDISASDLEGSTLTEVFPPENAEMLKPLYDAALTGESNITEITFQDRYFRLHVLPVHDDDGDVVAGMTMSQDITDQKQFEIKLDHARKRYQTLIETAPDPIFVADATTGQIIEANSAAEKLRGQPRAEIVGLHQSELHPPGDEEQYRALFENHVDEDGVRRRLDDGSQIYTVTGSDEKIPVAISAKSISLDDQEVIFGVFHDISDQVEYERALTALNEQTGELLRAESIPDIGRKIIDAATGIIDLPAVTLYYFDPDESVLKPAGHSERFEQLFGEPVAIGPGDGAVWRRFMEGETKCLDGDTGPAFALEPDRAPRKELIVPCGSRGLLVASRPQSQSCNSQTIELFEILANAAEAAFERTAREEALRARELELEHYTHKLEELESINSKIRQITQSLVQSDSREDIESAVCQRLASEDRFTFVWIGEPDPVTNRLGVRAQAGEDQGYLEQITWIIDETTDPEPSVRTIRTGTSIVESNTGENLDPESWRSHAVTRGFRSVMSIPLSYRDVSYGVLTLYSTEPAAFDDLIEDVLLELGETIAYGINAIKRKHAVMAEQSTELEFEITDTACLFLQFTQATGCTIEMAGLIPQSDESTLVLIRVKEGSGERLIEMVERSAAVEDPHEIGEGEGLVQLRFVEPFIATRLADHGINLKRITADDQSVQVTVRVPPTLSVHYVDEVIQTTYRNSTMLAKREETHSLDSLKRIPERFLDGLTERQRQAIELAFHSGYFESPKGATGAELAEVMDLSSSAFHNHLRAAEQKLFKSIFEGSHTIDDTADD